MSDVLHLSGVSLRRGPKTILHDVDWTVSDGDRWVVLGANGAGKTTVLQMAAARLFPSSGTVEVLGERLGTVDTFELRPRIGLASAALADRIPGHERVRNVVLTASYGVTGRWREDYDEYDTQRAADLLAAFGVEHLSDRTFGTLSEGERKRVQIARALMTDPELLLLDEPASGLDLAGREALVGAMAELFQHPAAPASVLVTHHVEEIPAGITHCMLMNHGRIVAAGELHETLTSDNLSAAFETPLGVRFDGRWSARGG